MSGAFYFFSFVLQAIAQDSQSGLDHTNHSRNRLLVGDFSKLTDTSVAAQEHCRTPIGLRERRPARGEGRRRRRPPAGGHGHGRAWKWRSLRGTLAASDRVSRHHPAPRSVIYAPRRLVTDVRVLGLSSPTRTEKKRALPVEYLDPGPGRSNHTLYCTPPMCSHTQATPRCPSPTAGGEPTDIHVSLCPAT